MTLFVSKYSLIASITILGASLVAKGRAASLPEATSQTMAHTQPPLIPGSGPPYNPVVTLNGWTLPWHLKDGVKEFHLVAEPVVRELAPGMNANLWGYNGQSPGPTIECVEGDKLRIFVTNKLPEHTTVPAMTMVFRVRDPAMLDELKEGDKIKFNAKRSTGRFS